MEYICSKSWSELQETKEQNIKYCNFCNKDVYFCDRNIDLEIALQKNLCIAFSNEEPDQFISPKRHMTLGLPKGYKGFNSTFGDNNESN